MKFEHTEVWGFEHALRGMRNPKESWHKSDSHYEDVEEYLSRERSDNIMPLYIVGENDMQLAQQLIRAGSEHRKFLRQIFASVDITAPLYWWKEYDTYKVGTVANSTSTMHTLQNNPITLECFEVDDCDISLELFDLSHIGERISSFVDFLEQLRKLYLDTDNKRYWKELIRWIPESWLQKRTVTLNYENLFSMCSKGQRRNHKLNEWSGKDFPLLPNFISWARELPYAQEFIFIDECF